MHMKYIPIVPFRCSPLRMDELVFFSENGSFLPTKKLHSRAFKKLNESTIVDFFLLKLIWRACLDDGISNSFLISNSRAVFSSNKFSSGWFYPYFAKLLLPSKFCYSRTFSEEDIFLREMLVNLYNIICEKKWRNKTQSVGRNEWLKRIHQQNLKTLKLRHFFSN